MLCLEPTWNSVYAAGNGFGCGPNPINTCEKATHTAAAGIRQTEIHHGLNRRPDDTEGYPDLVLRIAGNTPFGMHEVNLRHLTRVIYMRLEHVLLRYWNWVNQ